MDRLKIQLPDTASSHVDIAPKNLPLNAVSATAVGTNLDNLIHREIANSHTAHIETSQQRGLFDAPRHTAQTRNIPVGREDEDPLSGMAYRETRTVQDPSLATIERRMAAKPETGRKIDKYTVMMGSSRGPLLDDSFHQDQLAASVKQKLGGTRFALPGLLKKAATLFGPQDAQEKAMPRLKGMTNTLDSGYARNKDKVISGPADAAALNALSANLEMRQPKAATTASAPLGHMAQIPSPEEGKLRGTIKSGTITALTVEKPREIRETKVLVAAADAKTLDTLADDLNRSWAEKAQLTEVKKPVIPAPESKKAGVLSLVKKMVVRAAKEEQTFAEGLQQSGGTAKGFAK